MSSAKRHLDQLVAQDTTEDHAAAVLWNVAEFLHTLTRIEEGRLPKELDDRAEGDPLASQGITMANERSVRPKTFYLNERHQLAPAGDEVQRVWEHVGPFGGEALELTAEQRAGGWGVGTPGFLRSQPIGPFPKPQKQARKRATKKRG